MTVPVLAHQLEYHRLHLARHEDAGIDTWSVFFDHAWDAPLLDHCRRLLFGIKSNTAEL
jgi:hypothetical protein